MEETRTKNTIRNVRAGAIGQTINKIMIFIVRTVFIKMLNSEYVGINGLFTNILTILSFAELGIGTAIIFSMYKPVAEHDHEKIKSLMKLYKKSYTIIGIAVFILGLSVIPFMGLIVKDTTNIKENINGIYILFLLNTSISYFFSYKKSIIYAHQKQSVIDNLDCIFYVLKSLVEIVFLVLTRNFYAYLVIEIIATIIANITISIKASKMYPYLKEKNVKPLERRESKGIFNNVRSLVIYKLGGIIMNGTDNILISAMIDLKTVGLCSNYSMLINAVKTILVYALNGVTASVGNLNVVGEAKQKEKVFYQITFVNYVVFSCGAIAFIVLLNPFIKIWLGAEYILGLSILIALSVSFWIEGIRTPGYTYRTTLGLFQKAKSTPYIGALANIVLSIVLGRIYGVLGIFIATSVAQVVSYSWIDPYLIHKYEFKTPVSKYYKKFIIYVVIFAITTVLSVVIASFINFNWIIDFILKIIVVCMVPNIINVIIFRKSEEFIELKNKIVMPIVNNIKKKFTRK